MAETSDAALLAKFKTAALISWLSALVVGLLSWVTRWRGQEAIADVLLALVWICGGAFVICWALIMVSALVLYAARVKDGDGT